MRLAIEITTCTPQRTGIGYYTEHLVDALLETVSAGDDLVLLTNTPPAPELADRWAPHIHSCGPTVRSAWMQLAAPRLLAQTAADVGLFPNYAVPIASPCPTIAVVHDLSVLRLPAQATLQKRLLMRPMLEQVAATASLVGTVSDASRSDIVELLGVDDRRIVVLPGAAHPSCRAAPATRVAEVRARYGIADRYLLTVGTLEPRKDVLTLLRAFDRLRAEGEERELVIVGARGWKDRELVAAIDERGGGRGVRWLGYVAEDDLAALYTGADLFVFAPALEGFGLPLVEAMACGAPVVASDIPALREVGGDAPRFAPAGDETAFATAIREELDTTDGHAARRAKGLLRASCFSWRRTAETIWSRARTVGPSRIRSATNTHAPRASSVPVLPPPLHPPAPGFNASEWALLAAVAYADLFGAPLRIDHALAAPMGAALDEARLRRLATGPALAALLTIDSRGFLVLAGREALVDAAPAREASSRALLDRHERTLSMLAALPFVRSLVISGGVANRNVGARDDIDLFVVAAREHAYTAYTLLVLATTLMGTRHVICPNYVVDEDDLAIAYHRDLFTAHQLVSARAFSGRATFDALCRENELWVKTFFPGFAPGRTAPVAGHAGPSRAERAMGPLGAGLEAMLRWGWRARLRRRTVSAPQADVVLGDGILKLHLSDYRVRTLRRFSAYLDGVRARASSSHSRPALADVEHA